SLASLMGQLGKGEFHSRPRESNLTRSSGISTPGSAKCFGSGQSQGLSVAIGRYAPPHYLYPVRHRNGTGAGNIFPGNTTGHKYTAAPGAATSAGFARTAAGRRCDLSVKGHE